MQTRDSRQLLVPTLNDAAVPTLRPARRRPRRVCLHPHQLPARHLNSMSLRPKKRSCEDDVHLNKEPQSLPSATTCTSLHITANATATAARTWSCMFCRMQQQEIDSSTPHGQVVSLMNSGRGHRPLFRYSEESLLEALLTSIEIML